MATRFGLTAAVLILGGCFATEPVSYAQPGYAAPTGDVAEFDQALSPYGQWVDIPGYGRVWQPSQSVVGSDFVPYASNGYWVSTDYGWSFKTDWDWGWAPFHYGRWFQQPEYGWVWRPDNVWGASWCTWREGGGYVGWAPTPPEGRNVQISYTYVPTVRFVEPNPIAYAVPPMQVAQIHVMTQPIGEQAQNGNARWYRGPHEQVISQAIGRPIQRAPMAAAPPQPGRVVRGPIINAPPPSRARAAAPAPAQNPAMARPQPSAPRPAQNPVMARPQAPAPQPAQNPAMARPPPAAQRPVTAPQRAVPQARPATPPPPAEYHSGPQGQYRAPAQSPAPAQARRTQPAPARRPPPARENRPAAP